MEVKFMKAGNRDEWNNDTFIHDQIAVDTLSRYAQWLELTLDNLRRMSPKYPGQTIEDGEGKPFPTVNQANMIKEIVAFIEQHVKEWKEQYN